MNFEVKNALTELDRKTPDYFLQEIFHHGDTKVRCHASDVLRDLEPEQHTARVLREMLRLI